MVRYNLNDPRVRELAEQAEKGFQLLPEGWHYVRCQAVERKIINDKECWNVSFTVMPGEPNAQQPVRDSLWWTPDAQGRLLLALTAMGFPEDQLGSLDSEDVVAMNRLVGKTVLVEVKHNKSKKEPEKIYADITYGGYKAAFPGAVDELRKSRAADAATSSGPAAGGAVHGGGAAAGGGVDYGNVPF